MFNDVDSTVQKTRPGERFVCNADFEDYSVELIIRLDPDKGDHGILSVWDDEDIIVNSKIVELPEFERKDFDSYFDWFVNNRVEDFFEDSW